MICNLWHIKQTNGLYYYALDYVRAIGLPTAVYVRPALLDATRAALPGHHVRATGTGGIFRTLCLALLRSEQVFTPTSHPMPLHRHQLVIVHDDFPFLGRGGRLKRLLFHAGLQSSGCEVGHINHTTSLDALYGIPIRPPRLRYMPNSAPDTAVANALRAARALPRPPRTGRLRIALFGSDSPKKRYESLFDAIRKRRPDLYQFEVYGHANDYFHGLQRQFPDLDIRLAASAEIDLSTFLGSIDAVVSVASHEGFGRLIALALATGIPSFLLYSPVFAEFFSRSTPLYADIDTLVHALDRFEPAQASPTGFSEQTDLEQAFQTASRHLRTLAERHAA